MFEKTFSFWRRWVGQTPAAESVSTDSPGHADASAATTSLTQEDRRLWTRYGTDLAGTVQLAERPGSEKIPATIRDLSVGGANLLLEKSFQPGQILTVELPTDADEIRTVLACVVRLIPEQEGRWSVGCVFSRELSHEDLAHFGAKKIPAEDTDQRKWVRFACEMKASYRKVGDATNQAHPAQVLNISANGIGLAVTPPLDSGCLLNLDLTDKLGSCTHTILACVVHTTLRHNGELAVGCNFIRELNEQELHDLL